MYLAFVVPIFNEELLVPSLIQSLQEWNRRIQDSCIIVINDGSTDNSGSLLKDLSKENSQIVVINQPNQGQGPAIRHGYDYALKKGAEWIFQLDADCEIPINNFNSIWEKKGEKSLIQGVRLVRRDAFYRRTLSFINRVLLRFLFGVKLKDPNCPFRLIHGPYWSQLCTKIPEDVFTPNIFISILASRENKIVEIPVSHQKRAGGRSTLNIFKILLVTSRYLGDLMGFRKKLNAG